MVKENIIGLSIFILAIIFILIVNPISALLEPSSIYCNEMGYKFFVIETPEGQRGMCKMPDGEEISSWDFLQGKKGQEYSYCEKRGYVLKTIDDGVKCSSVFSRECAVCVLEDGKEIEVTKLMNLSFMEGVCGDGVCVIGENFMTCPQDCISGSFDTYCDGLKDDLCDPDCEPDEDPDCKSHEKPEEEIECIDGDGVCSCKCLEKDSDCEDNPIKPCIDPESEQYFPEKKEFNWLFILIPLIVIIIIIILIFVIKRKK